ncbi:hypothetical protein RB608_18080 [Nocardioides sp. LHD-245]|uniref:hypothetical protein n=1 Tax=Nocardioides sp. LHD-245 TaxID=3051387 RepID=UPI0027DEF8CD|nr:hypothetical protein [Nocardioides sp. LHD-245]
MGSFVSAVADLAREHGAEVRSRLITLREHREQIAAELAAVDRQVALFEGLLDLEPSPAPGQTLVFTKTDVPLTLHAAMAEVLKTAPERMMRASDLAAAIERRGLYKMRDGRPVEAQQIHARVGHYREMFTKDGTFIKLK